MAAKTFREWWDAQGPIDYQVDIRSAEFGWNAAKRAEVDKLARNMRTTPCSHHGTIEVTRGCHAHVCLNPYYT